LRTEDTEFIPKMGMLPKPNKNNDKQTFSKPHEGFDKGTVGTRASNSRASIF
jgi:hypothetical protein